MSEEGTGKRVAFQEMESSESEDPHMHRTRLGSHSSAGFQRLGGEESKSEERPIMSPISAGQFDEDEDVLDLQKNDEEVLANVNRKSTLDRLRSGTKGIQRKISSQTRRLRRRATSTESQDDGGRPVNQQDVDNAFVTEAIALAQQYRVLIEESDELLREEKEEMKFVAASSFMDDAWSRKIANFNLLRDPDALKARKLHSNKFFTSTLFLVIVVHMSLSFWETPSTWRKTECTSRIDEQRLLVLVEAMCFAFYILFFMTHSILYLFTMARTWCRVNIQKVDSGREKLYARFPRPVALELGKKWPYVQAAILFLMAFDLFMKFLLWNSNTSSRLGISFTTSLSVSRPLRPMLLILNVRVLRQMFSTMLAMLPSVFLLILSLVLLIVVYGIIGFNLFFDAYSATLFPETFSTISQASVSLFVLLSTENYPNIMWPGFKDHPFVTVVFFVSFLVIGGAIMAAILGVIFDTYRKVIVHESYRNFRKERLGLTAAFSLLTSCPLAAEGMTCYSFPCDHGYGVLTFETWRRLFRTFGFHGHASYVHDVYKRNMGKYYSNSDSMTLEMREKHMCDMLLPGFWKSLQNKKLQTSIASNRIVLNEATFNETGQPVIEYTSDIDGSGGSSLDMMSIDMAGFFSICDRIRSKLEVPQDRSILYCKKEWNALLGDILQGGMRPPMKTYRRVSLRGTGAFQPQKTSALVSEAESMYREFSKQYFKLHEERIVQLQRDFAPMNLSMKNEMRKFMVKRLKVFETRRYREVQREYSIDEEQKNILEFEHRFLKSLIWPSAVENIVFNKNFILATYLAIMLYFVLQMVMLSTDAFSLEILDKLLVVFFFIELNLKMIAQGSSFHKSKRDLFSFVLVLASLSCHIVLISRNQVLMKEGNFLQWDQRWLNAIASLPILRIFILLYSLLELKYNPVNNYRKKADKIHDQARKILEQSYGSTLKNPLSSLGNFDDLDSSMFSLQSTKQRQPLYEEPEEYKDDAEELHEVSSTKRRGSNVDTTLRRLSRFNSDAQRRKDVQLPSYAVEKLLDTESEKSKAMEQVLALKNLITNLTRILITILVVVFVIFYTFAIIGMEVFSCRGIENDAQGNNYTTFNNLEQSYLLLFQVAVTNDWQNILYPVIRATSMYSVLFFLAFYVFVVLVVLNLLAALVVEAFENVRDKQKIEERKKILQQETTFGMYARFVA